MGWECLASRERTFIVPRGCVRVSPISVRKMEPYSQALATLKIAFSGEIAVIAQLSHRRRQKSGLAAIGIGSSPWGSGPKGPIGFSAQMASAHTASACR